MQIPKGQNLTQRTLEHFYFWGCVDQLRAARVMPPGYPIGGVTAYGNLMSDYWYTQVGREVVRPYYFQDNERLPQYLTEAVLRERASELEDVTCRFGWTATSVEQDDRGVRVTVVPEDGAGAPQVLEAAYVVGCDGPRSMVRDQVGIDRVGLSRSGPLERRMVLAVFRSRALHEGLRRFPDRTTYRVMHPAYEGFWQFFGRVDVGEGWFFHAPVPSDTTPQPADVHELLQRAAGFTFPCEFEHVGFWDLRVEMATRYRQDLAFIAGDASHTHPPYGGFGLNTGLEDAANLGWKLAAVLDGWAGERLLHSYGEERVPIFAETGETVIAGGIERDREFLERYSPERDRTQFECAWHRMASGTPGPQSYEPHYEGSSVVAGSPGAVCGVQGSHSFAARAGHHLPPRPLSDGRDVFEELGPDFTLLALGDGNGAVPAFRQAARALRIPLSVVEDGYDGERRAYEAPLVLVRPDQDVVWAGDRPPRDVAGLLEKVVGIA
jgi:2-polyprenyl-6-methoxyphenol hydroxylase-like FAD-dependent oxidoreductase